MVSCALDTWKLKIKQAIKVVYSGNMVMQDGVMEKVMKAKETFNGIKLDKELFTEREMEIIASIAEGLTNKQVAAKLFISEGTVKNYISSILNKTDLNHRTQIAIYYLKGCTKT